MSPSWPAGGTYFRARLTDRPAAVKRRMETSRAARSGRFHWAYKCTSKGRPLASSTIRRTARSPSTGCGLDPVAPAYLPKVKVLPGYTPKRRGFPDGWAARTGPAVPASRRTRDATASTGRRVTVSEFGGGPRHTFLASRDDDRRGRRGDAHRPVVVGRAPLQDQVRGDRRLPRRSREVERCPGQSGRSLAD